jgi:hypothetical protein
MTNDLIALLAAYGPYGCERQLNFYVIPQLKMAYYDGFEERFIEAFRREVLGAYLFENFELARDIV